MGYAVLIPDIYYRAGRWAPFDASASDRHWAALRDLYRSRL
jgi:dienelactone hydrolase